MLALSPKEKPESLAEFNKKYFVKEFDGQADNCAEKTWPVRK